MATNDTAALVVALSAQLTKFEKDMDKAFNIADQGSKRIEQRFSKIDPGGGGEFASKLEKLLTAGGIVGAVTSLHEMVAELAKVGDQAERVGLTAEQFQQLRFAVVATGGSVDAAGSFMDRFSRSVSEAGRGAGELYKTFQLNNVAIKDANGNLLPANELLGKFADLVKNAKNAQDQMNLAVMAGGRQAGPEFVGVLKRGVDGLREWATEADRAGVVASEAMIRRAKEIDSEFNKLWLRLKVGAAGFALDVAEEVKEQSKRMVADAQNTATEIKSTWQSIVDYIRDHAPQGLSFLSDDQKKLLELGAGIRSQGVLDDNRTTAEGILRSGQGTPLTGNLSGFPGQPKESLGDGSTKLFNEQSEAFRKLLEIEDQRIKLLGAEAAAVGLTAGAAEELKTKVNLETAAKRANIPLTAERLAAIDEEARRVGQAAQAVDDYKRRFAGINSAAQFAGNEVIDIMDGLRNKTLTAADAVKHLANSFIHAAEQALLLGSGPLAGIFGSAPAVTGGTGGLIGALLGGARAMGGPVEAGRGYLVNEDTPNSEIFVPGVSGTIVPANIAGRSGGTRIAITNVIDARNADPGVEARIMQRLPGVVAVATANAVKSVPQARRNNPGYFG